MLKNINDLKEKELEKLWKKEEELEYNEKCPYCKKYTLIGTNPFEINLMCSKCGKIFDENINEI